ncbi:MAG: hypothetical protein HYS60_02175 [Candidatus Wildermuthbacteria bacterium]|nr:hypothetical protein [Candidatus Wildermuthbacteria bacterium]
MTVDFFKHRYGYEIEGAWMPRVTAVTSLLSKANMFASQASADWGTLVHETIGSLLRGDSIQIDSRIAPSLRAFEEWKGTHGFELKDPQESIEKRVFDFEHAYAGTVDLIANVQGSRGLIDLKTSTAIRDEHSLQTAAYFSAYNQNAKESLRCTMRGIVRIDQYQACLGCFAKQRQKGRKETVSGGNPACNHQWSQAKGEIEFRELPDHQEDFEAFLAAKEVWEWYYRDMLKRIANYPKKVTQKILL